MRAIDVALARLRALKTMRALQRVPVGERSILPGRMTGAFASTTFPSRMSVPTNWQKEMFGVREAELIAGRGDDADTHLGQIAPFVGHDREAESRRIYDHELSPP